MIRNPWSISSYRGKWKTSDRRWTKDYLAQVPHGINPLQSERDGIFFVESDQMLKSFNQLAIGHYRPDYQISWYDKENDYGE